MSDGVNDLYINRIDGSESVYEALDTDHHGYPLREADKLTILKYCERLPDKLVLKVGARFVLRRNINIDGGWVNGSLAVVTSLHRSCIVIAKLADLPTSILSPDSDCRLKSVGHPIAFCVSNFHFSWLMVSQCNVYRVVQFKRQ